ncbi:hypothetical protein I3760_09G083100 [Carya illinoinensis]|nr:hypothetical protein I3760_09G083100 [Carya illinoinensis]
MNRPHISPRFIRLLTFSAFLTLLLWELAYADPPYSFCPNTSADYRDDSPFKNNLDELLISLSSKASSSKFYNTSTGNDTDRVYGVHMCLDYVTNENCGKCIATATKDILKLCPYTREAVVWEELCQLRYSNQNFFGQVNLTGNKHQYNPMNLSQPLQFKYRSVVKETLNNLTTEAAAFNLSAKLRYATGEVDFEDKTIYALVECTRDLSGDGCNSCLERAIADVLNCCYFSIGARLFSSSCFLRYEFYNFYKYGATSSMNAQGSGSGGRKIWMIIMVVSACLAMVLFASGIYCLANKKAWKRKEEFVCQRANNSNPSVSRFHHRNFQERYDPQAQDFPYIELSSIQAATDNFSDSNKLGEGGFGPVYKGSEEFINEVLLIMKLQHKNLVKLLGFCVEGDERLLVYEFMPNNSLDVFLFDRSRCAQLSWSRRLNIIDGIARGILYLHQDSRLRIIHRDLKPSNVLLDYDMNPKISDFGMARIFEGSEGEANNSTAQIAGTYGYMAPEYAMDGLYSIKSDVFSFGVLLIEIMSGIRNAGFHRSKRAPSLLAYAWQLWNEGKAMELLDPLLIDSCCADEFLRYIHVGLLCVEEDANYRPTMSSVVATLKSEPGTLCQPERPAFCVGRFIDLDEADPDNLSFNGLSISILGHGDRWSTEWIL